MEVPIFAWVATLGVILGMLAVDLLVFHREAHEVGSREAGIWTLVWVALGLGFGGVVAWHWGAHLAGQYLAGYVIEKSLAVDNIFVFAVIFSALSIPARHQHRVLYWGVLGALLMRAGFIAGGVALLEHFHWAIYLFGGLLLVTAWRMWAQRAHHPDPAANRTLAWLRRHLPMTHHLEGQHFFTREKGRRVATPLLAALVAVEVADVVFAVDSIPAVFAVTREPFLVFTSNVFAILGLRSMYFFLADMIRRFQYLTVGLSVVLALVGAKMLLSDVVQVPILASLGTIVGILAVSVAVSLYRTGRAAAVPVGTPAAPDDADA